MDEQPPPLRSNLTSYLKSMAQARHMPLLWLFGLSSLLTLLEEGRKKENLPH